MSVCLVLMPIPFLNQDFNLENFLSQKIHFERWHSSVSRSSIITVPAITKPQRILCLPLNLLLTLSGILLPMFTFHQLKYQIRNSPISEVFFDLPVRFYGPSICLFFTYSSVVFFITWLHNIILVHK